MSHAIEWSTNITVRQVIRYSLHQGQFLTFCITMSLLKLDECENADYKGNIAVCMCSFSIPWQHQEGFLEGI